MCDMDLKECIKIKEATENKDCDGKHGSTCVMQAKPVQLLCKKTQGMMQHMGKEIERNMA